MLAWINLKNDFLHFIKSKSLLSNLFIANVLAALFLLFANIINLGHNVTLFDYVLQKFSMHPNVNLFLKTPWSIVTYIFIHTNFWSLLFSSAMLYFIGILCSRYLGQRRFFATYFVGAIVGALFLMLFHYLLPAYFGEQNANLMLVSAYPAVFAVFFAIVIYIPEYQLYRNIRLKHLAYIFAGLEVIMFISDTNPVYIASIGGALYGMFSVYLPRKLKYKPKPKMKYKEVKTEHKRPLTDEEYNKQRADKQKQIDAILDKISQSGYDSLTTKEKEILFSESNKKE